MFKSALGNVLTNSSKSSLLISGICRLCGGWFSFIIVQGHWSTLSHTLLSLTFKKSWSLPGFVSNRVWKCSWPDHKQTTKWVVYRLRDVCVKHLIWSRRRNIALTLMTLETAPANGTNVGVIIINVKKKWIQLIQVQFQGETAIIFSRADEKVIIHLFCNDQQPSHWVSHSYGFVPHLSKTFS